MVLLLQIIGSTLEVIGAYLIANLYFETVVGRQIPIMLIHAIWRGPKAKDAIALTGISKENKLISLQGIAFIGVGFLFQLLASVVSLCTHVKT